MADRLLKPGDRVMVVGPGDRGEILTRFMLSEEDGGLHYRVRLDDGRIMTLLDTSVEAEKRCPSP